LDKDLHKKNKKEITFSSEKSLKRIEKFFSTIVSKHVEYFKKTHIYSQKTKGYIKTGS